MTINAYERLILEWAKEKGIDSPHNITNQFIKLVEEQGELANDILKGNREAAVLEAGDMLVVLTILLKQLDSSMGEAMDLAYNKIKDRTGKTVNGTFIKD